MSRDSTLALRFVICIKCGQEGPSGGRGMCRVCYCAWYDTERRPARAKAASEAAMPRRPGVYWCAQCHRRKVGRPEALCAVCGPVYEHAPAGDRASSAWVAQFIGDILP